MAFEIAAELRTAGEKLVKAIKEDPGTAASTGAEMLGISIGLAQSTAGDIEGGRNSMYMGIAAGNAINFCVQAYQVIKKRGKDWQGDVKDFFVRAAGGLTSIGFQEIADAFNIPHILAIIPTGIFEWATTVAASDFKKIVGKLHVAEGERATAIGKLAETDDTLRSVLDLVTDTVNANAEILDRGTVSLHDDE